MSITNKLNQIKNAIYGKEVRGAIHDAIKECYDDATVNHDNANMEVKMARGTHNTLNDRLNKSDEIQAQTNAQLSQKASLSDLDVERNRIDSFTSLQQGSTTGDAELIDGRIGADNVVYNNIGDAIRTQLKNKVVEIILPYQLTDGEYINYENGRVETLSTRSRTDFIKLISGGVVCFKNLNYQEKDSGGVAFYNCNKKFISGYQYDFESDVEITIPDDAKYMRFTVRKNHKNVIAYQKQYETISQLDANMEVLKGYIHNVNLSPELVGKYVNCDGVLSSQQQYSTSNKFRVKKSNKLIAYVEGYLSNVSVISKVETVGDVVKYTPLVISEDGVAKYEYVAHEDMDIVLSGRSDFEWSATILSLNEEYLNEIDSDIRSVRDVNTTFKDGIYINWSTGEQSNLSSRSATDYIKLSAIDNKLVVKNLNHNTKDATGLAFYDKDKVFISGYQYSVENDIVVNIPLGSKYARVSAMKLSAPNVTIHTQMIANKSIEVLNDKIDKLSYGFEDYNYCQIFHRIGGIGDSLMSGGIGFNEDGISKYYNLHKYSWLSNLCKNIGSEAVHYSVGGLTTKTWLEQKLSEVKNETNLPSAYFIALGTNDRTKGVALGSSEDCGTEAETFYGMYSKIINEVKNKNPKAKIFCFSLYFHPTNQEVINYSNAVKYMCDKYGCYYVDFLNNYADQYTSTSEFVSSSHFTTTGYVRVARHVEKLINDIIKANHDDFKFVGLEYQDII